MAKEALGRHFYIFAQSTDPQFESNVYVAWEDEAGKGGYNDSVLVIEGQEELVQVAEKLQSRSSDITRVFLQAPIDMPEIERIGNNITFNRDLNSKEKKIFRIAYWGFKTK